MSESVDRILAEGMKAAHAQAAPDSCKPAVSIALEAYKLVVGARQEYYGHPLDDFTRTAKIWSAILGIEVTAEQVGLCMIGVKIARQVNHEKIDNLIDIAGYAETLNLISEKRNADK